MKKNQKNTTCHHFKDGMVCKIVRPCYTAFAIGFLILISLNSCKKLIEIKPSSTQILGSEVYADSVTVQSTLGGMYVRLASTASYRYGFSTWCGFSADEMQYVGSTYDAFINNGLLSTDSYQSDIWSSSYAVIYVANSIIEGVTSGSGLSDKFKNQALAEAKFIRAFCYFHLVNIYGYVPLILGTDVTKNTVAPRTASPDVYTQIMADLNFAQANLPSDYSISSNTRTRANK